MQIKQLTLNLIILNIILKTKKKKIHHYNVIVLIKKYIWNNSTQLKNKRGKFLNNDFYYNFLLFKFKIIYLAQKNMSV